MSQEFRWLIRQAYPFRSLYMLQLSAVGLVSFLSLIDPLILKWLIDEVVAWRKVGMLPIVAGAFFGIFLFRFGFSAMNRLLDVYASQRLTFDIRCRLFRHLQYLSPDFYLDHSRGDLLHRLENDIEQISTVGGKTLVSLARIAVMTLLSIAIMLVLDWQMTLIVLPLVPIMAMLRRLSQPRLKEASERVQKAVGQRYSFLASQLANMIQVQLLNRQAGERRRLGQVGRRALEANVRRSLAELMLSFSYQVSITTAGAAVLGFGGYRVLEGVLTIGGLVAFYSYLVRIFEPMGVMVRLYSDFMRAMVSIRRLMELFETRPTIVDPPQPRPLDDQAPAVSFRQVQFSYREDQPVLQGFDLEIEAGEKVALVGASGGGKSTVGRLLTRQYDAQYGSVEIDDIAVDQVRLKELRNKVAIVPQDPALFDVSLRENLLYAAPNTSEEELRRVLEIAQLKTMTKALQEGWSSPVGKRGERLSGGQRQRVAIARALLQRAPLLILDEATSALDGFTEHRLLQSLRCAVADRTVIVIAHRLPAMRWADRIVVIEQGKVLDQGSHPELYARCEPYRELVDKQSLQDRHPLPMPRTAEVAEVVAR